MISPMRISGRLASMLDLGRAMALAVLLVFAAVPADAAQDARLDPLFEKLKAASDAREAQIYENAIWRVWLEPEDGAVNSLMRLGLDAQNRGDMFGAFAIYDAITGLKPDYAEGWNRRATAFFLSGEFKRSLADCDEVLKRNPFHFGALAGSGQNWFHLGQYDKAITAWRRALEVNPNLEGIEDSIEVATRLQERKQRNLVRAAAPPTGA